MTDLKTYELKVASVTQETPDTRSIAFAIPAELREVFAYRAGQFLTFEIPWGDFSIHRSYSVSSAPAWDPRPKVTIKRVPSGRMSNWMNDNVSVGDTLRVQAPAGRFVLHPSDRPLRMFAGGSGITPMLALIKAALLATDRDIALLYANRDDVSIIFKRELQLLEARYPARLRIVHHLDDAAGFCTPDEIDEFIGDGTNFDAYICGPEPFMDLAEERLVGAGVPVSQIHVERFVSPTDPDRKVETGHAPTETYLAGVAEVTLNRKQHAVPYEAGETLLDAVRRAGLAPEFQCEEGYCACCMAKMSAGAAAMAINDALSEREVGEGWTLTCQARCTTPKCTLDFDAF